MGRDYAKGRGRYRNPIDLKYIQLPRKIYEILFLQYSYIPESVRGIALIRFINHFFTNCGYESLKVQDSQAYMLCNIMDEATQLTQNNSRWRCFDEFYKGRDDIDYEMAWDLHLEEQKQKKKELNKKNYRERKQREMPAPNPEKEREETLEYLRQLAEERENRM